MNFTSKSLDTCDNSSMIRVPNGKDRKGSKNISNNNGQNFPNLIRKKYVYIHMHTHTHKGVGCQLLLQGTFPIPRMNPYILNPLHWWVGSYH